MMKNTFSDFIKREPFFDFLVLFPVLALATFFRFFNFTTRISMGPDSARDAFVALMGAKYLQLPTTGPFISIAPVTTGPWYWIQLIIGRLILPTNYAPWIVIGVYSLSLVIVMYIIGKVLAGRRLGVILAIIAALSANQIDNAVQLTNPAVIGFFAGTIVLLFLIALKNSRNMKLAFAMGVVLGLCVNTHYQSFGLLSLPLLLLFYGRKYVEFLKRLSLGFILTFLPLLWFELNNHWFDTRHMLQYLLVDQYKIWTPMSWTIYVKEYWPTFFAFVTGMRKEAAMVMILFIGVVFLYGFIRKKIATPYIFLIISFVIQVVIIRYYRGERYFGYLQFFHPYLFIFTGFVVDKLFTLKYGRILGSLAILIYISLVFPTSISKIKADQLTVDTKFTAENMQKIFGTGPYKIYKCQDLLQQNIQALVLQLEMTGKYSKAGKPIIYDWGCTLPRVRLDGTVITDEELDKNADTIYPKLGRLRDISAASPSALFSFGWNEASPESMYQSAARWWMDEQP